MLGTDTGGGGVARALWERVRGGEPVRRGVVPTTDDAHIDVVVSLLRNHVYIPYVYCRLACTSTVYTVYHSSVVSYSTLYILLSIQSITDDCW